VVFVVVPLQYDSCYTLCLLLNSVQDEETALMVAARHGSLGIARKLIQHGQCEPHLQGNFICSMFGVNPDITLVYADSVTLGHVHSQ